MTAYLNLIVSFCNKIVAMMSDNSIASILGAPFIYIAFSFFMIWMAANIFLIHPVSIGPLFITGIQKSSRTKETSNSEKSHNQNINSHKSNYHKDYVEIHLSDDGFKDL